MSTSIECIHQKTIDLSIAIAGIEEQQRDQKLRNPLDPKASKLPDALICLSVS